MYIPTYAGVYSIPEVNMIAYGPYTSDLITLCPDQDFMIVFECTVTDSEILLWRADSLLSIPIQVSTEDQLGERPQAKANVVFTEKMTRLKSQLQVHSSDILETVMNNGALLNITCEVSSTVKSVISLRISGDYTCGVQHLYFMTLLVNGWQFNNNERN